jgi:diguanylate cyclase (GGDEF)-like protein
MNEQLVKRVKQCPSLPSLPAIAVQVLDLAQKPEVDIAEIARIISKDPALSGKILRTVNSSFYGRSQAVSTISHSLVILGLQSVKTLVLGFSLVTTLTKNKPKGFKHLIYWKRSIYAATAARTLAAKINLVQQEEAFLGALLMDIGMLVLDQVLGDEYGEICGNVPHHSDLADVERDALQMTHAEAGGILAEQWKLPPLLAVPLANHHSAEQVQDAALRKLAELIHLSGHCADVFVDSAPAPAIAEVRRLCFDRYNLSEPDVDLLLGEIGKRTREVASLFEINIGTAAEYDSILKKANEALVEITLKSQRQATTLARENIKLQQAATTDGLTGLANRARFDQFITEAFTAAQKSRQPLALLLLDLDKFKQINDQFGHPAGDAVLRHLGRLFRSAARPQDLAARYGGEEIALVLREAPRQAAATLAETIRRALAARPVAHGNIIIPVTASVGVSCYDPAIPFANVAQFIKAADLALYNAKHSGRNCVRLFSLKPSAVASAAPAAAPAQPA